MGVDAFGIDVSPEMVRMAVRKLKCKDRFFVGDLCSPALEPESFGLAIAARAFCHVEDIFSAFSAAYRLVRPNGILIVTELDVDHEFERTRIPTPDGKLQVDTWKRSNEELIGVARLAGWNLSRLSRVSAINCAWLPEGKGLASIDRASDRVIFNVLSFCRT
jgi:SAM-dependent methyltransferase